MKNKFLVMIITVVIAAVIYVMGCGLIDKLTAVAADVEGKLAQQPAFTNTVGAWDN